MFTAEMLLDWMIKAGMLVAFAGGLSLVGRRWSAGMRHCIWSAAMAGCLALPVLSMILPNWGVMPLGPHGAERGPAMARDVGREKPAAPAAVALDGSGNAADTPKEWRARGPLDRGTLSSEMIVAGYAIGAVFLLVRVLASPLVWRSMIQRSSPFQDAGARVILANIAARMRVGRPVLLLESRTCDVPLAVGIVRPSIILPAGAASWDTERLRMVLTHEMLHILRWDAITQLAARVVCAAYWCNPLVWLASNRQAYWRERAVDDGVLAGGERPSVYGAALLAVAEAMGTSTINAARVTALAMLRPNARGKRLESRLQAILANNINRRNSRKAVAGVCTLLVGFTLLAAAPGQSASATAKSELTAEELGNVHRHIETLKSYVWRTNAPETFAAVRDLIKVGKPAVPEICAALETCKNRETVTLMAYVLRNIKDQRAVPSLIKALEQAPLLQPERSDVIMDQGLYQFVWNHSFVRDQAAPRAAPVRPSGLPTAGEPDVPPAVLKFDGQIRISRSDEEIVMALREITGHSVSNMKWYVPRQNQTEPNDAGEKRKAADVELWNKWWQEHEKDAVK